MQDRIFKPCIQFLDLYIYTSKYVFDCGTCMRNSRVGDCIIRGNSRIGYCTVVASYKL